MKPQATFIVSVAGLLLAAVGVALFLSAADDAEPALPWFKGNLHTHSLWSDGNADGPVCLAA